MKSPIRIFISSTVCLMLWSCDSPAPVDPAENMAGNVFINSAGSQVPQDEERRELDQVGQDSSSADKEPAMPEPKTRPPAPKPSSPPPRPDVRPSPWQPPAEIDPVPPDPGTEVPR